LNHKIGFSHLDITGIQLFDSSSFIHFERLSRDSIDSFVSDFLCSFLDCLLESRFCCCIRDHVVPDSEDLSADRDHANLRAFGASSPWSGILLLLGS
jgi:hypothetical protein